MPKGQFSKLAKRVKAGGTPRNMRKETQQQFATGFVASKKLEIDDVITRGWWLPTSGENTDEELWAQLWPR